LAFIVTEVASAAVSVSVQFRRIVIEAALAGGAGFTGRAGRSNNPLKKG